MNGANIPNHSNDESRSLYLSLSISPSLDAKIRAKTIEMMLLYVVAFFYHFYLLLLQYHTLSGLQLQWFVFISVSISVLCHLQPFQYTELNSSTIKCCAVHLLRGYFSSSCIWWSHTNDRVTKTTITKVRRRRTTGRRRRREKNE